MTVCTKNRQPLFWNPVGADIIRPNLSEYGKIVENALNAIPVHYPTINVDEYVIMPDHVHMILIVMSDDDESGQIISAPTIERVVGQMKRWVSKEAGFSVWQKSFFEHVIRNEDDYVNTVAYIRNNIDKLMYTP